MTIELIVQPIRNRNEATKEKISMKQKELYATNQRPKIRLFGNHNPMYNKRGILSPNYGRKRYDVTLRNKLNNPTKNPLVRMKISQKLTGRIGNMLGKKCSLQTKKKIGLKSREVWIEKKKNREFMEKWIKQFIKNTRIRPTKLESKFNDLLQKYNLPYKYVGDGSFLIGFKNPDFININGEKICVEVRSVKVTEFADKTTKEEYAKKRIDHFNKCGWKCVVIFDDELNDENYVVRRMI